MSGLSKAEEAQLKGYRSLYLNNDRYTALAAEPLLQQVYAAQAKAEIFFDANSCSTDLKKQFLDAVREHVLVALAKKHTVATDVTLDDEDIDAVIAGMLN